MTAPALTGAVWRKSSRSNGQGQCVEVAQIGTVVAVRDSKNPSDAVLVFTSTAWTAFLTQTRVGTFDL